jgi:hypothetical protein
MGINVYYNYYAPKDPRRAEEVDAVFSSWTRNKFVDKLVIIKDPHTTLPAKPFLEIPLPTQPTFKDYGEVINRVTSDEDINILTNADCFIAQEDTERLHELDKDAAYCLSRIEVKSIRPLKKYWRRNWVRRRKRSHDSQDCWIVRGRLKPGMWLDFPMGKPGCDCRFAYELQTAGYRIIDPAATIRLYHFHTSTARKYYEEPWVPPPYAFPQRMPRGKR